MNQDHPVWLDTKQAAVLAKRSVVTIRRAVASGELHSHQPRPRAKRHLAQASVEAWMLGLGEKAPASECGCVHLQLVTRRGAA